MVKYILFIFKKATFYIQNIEALEFLVANVFYILETTRKINSQLKTYPCVFIRYSLLHKGYRCLYPSTEGVHISRHVVFNEIFFPYANLFVKENHLHIPIEMVSLLTLDTWCETRKTNQQNKLWKENTTNQPSKCAI